MANLNPHGRPEAANRPCSLGDLSGGKGSRPVVRFRLIDGEDFEKRVLQNPLAEINEEKQTG